MHGRTRQFQDSRRLIREALEAGDSATIYHLDPLFEVRMNDGWNAKAPTSVEDVSGPAARPVDGLFARKAILACAGAAFLVAGGPVWYARNVASDEAMFDNAKRSGSTWALAEAQEKGTVTALREFLDAHKGSVVEKEARDSMHGPPPAAIDVPTLDIRYKLGWAGDTYSEEKGNRRFVGILVSFNVSMRIPGQPESFDFDLEVTPPEHFTVDYSRPSGRFNAADLLGNNPSDGPSEGQVYDVMAERAFDQLTTKLRSVFFRPGSKAFRGTQDPPDNLEAIPRPPGLDLPPRRGTEL